MSSGKPDINAITISNGKSPDRSKNMNNSVYSHSQSLSGTGVPSGSGHYIGSHHGHLQPSNPNSHQGSSGVINNANTTRSPYLGMPVPGMNLTGNNSNSSANNHNTQQPNLKKRLENKDSSSVTRKKDSGGASMLANANYKNALLSGNIGTGAGMNQHTQGTGQ